jgi:hypothetical protein
MDGDSIDGLVEEHAVIPHAEAQQTAKFSL